MVMTDCKRPLQRPGRIFSGKNSKDFWRAVSKTRKDGKRTEDAFYLLGCYCQELETIVRALEDRLARLEDC